MNSYADLEIAIRRGAGDEGALRHYTVEMRFSAPDSDTEDRLLGAGDASLRLDPAMFTQPINGWKQYGQSLRDAFFADPSIRPAFDKAVTGAGSAMLRVRLYIEPQAVELQRIHWEAMADPDEKRVLPLFANESVAFSRYLNSGDFRPVRSRQNAERLKVLIVVASPTDLAARGFRPIDQAVELKRATDALGDRLEIVTLTTQGNATMANIVAELRKGVDILYLVCHGQAAQVRDGWEAVLYLEKADGTLDRANGAELVQRIQDLPERPRLIVLASCQSAGDGTAFDPAAESFVGAIGPRFAEAGIPAVLAMSGNLTMETGAQFVPTFFRELLSEVGAGQIDRAVSLARYAVKDRPDCWMPSLFMRLRSGRVWYIAGFTADDKVNWDSICSYVDEGDFVPVVGPDLPSLLQGNMRDYAAKLAEKNGFPLAPWSVGELSKVTQFMTTRAGIDRVRKDVRNVRMKGVRERFPESEAKFPDISRDDEDRDLQQDAMAGLMGDPENPYTVLTSLKARVYLTTTPDALLEIALTQAKKAPQVFPCQWRDERRDSTAAPPKLTSAAPGLFYVFGKSAPETEETWVLTEDDIFDYLIRTSRDKVWPSFVTNAIASGTLFFIGFPVDDWRFQVLVRMILQSEAVQMVLKKNHICVQVDPDETSFSDAIRARRYFEKCFSLSKIDIYWGTSREFLRDLSRQLKTWRAKNK